MPDLATTNTDGDADESLDSMLAEVTEGLFGQEPSETDVTTPSVEPGEIQTPTVEAPPAQTEEIPPTNTPEVAATGAPQTWSKEAIAEWATISPRAQQEILKREQDMFKGLETYKEKADLGTKYDTVVEPYRATLQAENVDPVQLFQSFAGNHYILARGTPEQKVQLAANLLSSYGIPIEAVQNFLGNQPPANPQFDQVNQRVQTLEQEIAQRNQRENDARKDQFRKDVEAFSADPKNIYFTEVASDIANLLKTGAATSLSAAYEMAVYSNPTTRQKELDRLTAETLKTREKEEADRVAKAQKAKGANVNTKAKTVDGTIPVGSMDETLNETLANIKSRG